MNKSSIKYITKRMIASRSRQAFMRASKRAMEDHGYVIIAKHDKIIKQYIDGREEELSNIPVTKQTGPPLFD